MSKQKRKKIIIIVTIMMILSLLCVFYGQINPFVIKSLANSFKIVSNKDNLLVHFINVDQADAVAINLPDGKVALIDAGQEDHNVTFIKYIKENVLNGAKEKTIDYLILSHAHEDHVGGSLKLLQNFKINNIFLPKIDGESKVYQKFLQIVKEEHNYKWLDGEFVIGDKNYSLTFFNKPNSNNIDEMSQLIRLDYQNTSFLFTGDIGEDAENYYIENYSQYLDVDVLKVAHHGSNTSSQIQFLEKVTPKYSVISCGVNNQYGHPHDEVISRLNTVNTKVLRTDKQGNILFVQGDNYYLKCISGFYYITNLTLNYTYFIIVIEVVLFICVIVILIRKEKTNKYIKT